MSWCQTRKNKKQVVGLRMAADALEQIANFAMQAAMALFTVKQGNSSNNKTLKRARSNNNNNYNVPMKQVKMKAKQNPESHNQTITLRSKTISVPTSKPVKKKPAKKPPAKPSSARSPRAGARSPARASARRAKA